MYEIHLLRAIDTEKNKSLSPRKKLQQLNGSLKQSKKELRTMLEKVWTKTRDIREEEIEKLVDEAVKTVRKKR
ncbi:MAG: hypothetical protein HZA77_02250 [Candidatus Schekmanbacteria bacterium]|nr:hypothetical protein [Candidatus Schekmanbacteria bacterium]